MNHPEYITRRKQVQLAYGSNGPGQYAGMEARFALTSANLLNILPDIAIESHSGLFSDILFHQAMSGLEQKYPGVLSYIEATFDCEATETCLMHRPTVICTFHSGSYRTINHYLLNKGISFQLVVAGKVNKVQGETFYQDLRSFYPDRQDSFGVIDASSSFAGIRMLKALRSGKSLLIYIDGNTGALTEDVDKSALIRRGRVNFYARCGFATIAALAGAPIIPVTCFRPSLERISLKFQQPIYYVSSLTKELFAQEVTGKLYHDFFDHLGQFPSQWEGWLYIHTHMKNNPENSTPPSFNYLIKQVNKSPLLFHLFTINDQFILFDKRQYISFEISDKQYEQLRCL